MEQPIKSLSRVIMRITKREEANLFHLYNEFAGCPNYIAPTLVNAHVEDEDVDANSISSYSTNATADDLPGPGRLVDKFFYQPVGRKIERFAMKIKISNLSPARISCYIEKEFRQQRGWTWTDRSLNEVVSDIYKRHNGLAAVAGLKSLVKHAQSRNIHRSAAALTALIRVSADYDLTPFYVAVSSVEPIFQLESLALLLDNAHPEKEWLLFLASLAKTKNEVIKPSEPSIELARNLRQMLIRLLGPHQYSVNPLTVLGEVCSLLAKGASCVRKGRRGSSYLHIVGTVQLAASFILQSTLNLAICLGIESRPQIVATLSTMIHWLDTTLYRCLLFLSALPMFDRELMMAASALRGLILAAKSAGIILERSCSGTKQLFILARNALPRRIRNTVDYDEDPGIIKNLVETSVRSFGSLLSSFNKLEREIQFGASGNILSSLTETNEDLDEGWSETLMRTLDRARKIKVEKSELSEEFLKARAPSRCEGKEDMEGWDNYKRACQARHGWAPYFCSNLDWEPDVTCYMEHMFKPPATSKQMHLEPFPPSQGSSALHPTPDLDVSSGDTWNISTGPSRRGLPKEVRIAYTTETGEIIYQTFVAAPSVEHVASPGVLAEPSDPLHIPSKSYINGLAEGDEEDLRVSEATNDEKLGRNFISERLLLKDTDEAFRDEMPGSANRDLSEANVGADQVSLYSFL